MSELDSASNTSATLTRSTVKWRRSLSVAAAISLLLCIAMCTLWLRGRLAVDHVNWSRIRWPESDVFRSLFIEVQSGSGTLALIVSRCDVDPVHFAAQGTQWTEDFRQSHVTHKRWQHWRESAPSKTSAEQLEPGFAARHFDYARGAVGYREDTWVLGVPQWLLAALLVVLPVVWIYRLRPRFSLRAFLIGIAVLSIPMGWVAHQLDWIRQRHEFLRRPLSVDYSGPVMTPRALPWSLGMLGERAQEIVFTPKATADEAKRLFPESQIQIVPDWPNRPPQNR